MKECLHPLAIPQSKIETQTRHLNTLIVCTASFLQMLVAVKFSTCINTRIKLDEDDTGSTVKSRQEQKPAPLPR